MLAMSSHPRLAFLQSLVDQRFPPGSIDLTHLILDLQVLRNAASRLRADKERASHPTWIYRSHPPDPWIYLQVLRNAASRLRADKERAEARSTVDQRIQLNASKIARTRDLRKEVGEGEKREGRGGRGGGGREGE